jgi:transcriptional regulator with XRE-family HTH domain
MKPENSKPSKHYLTDDERNNVLKLMTCGLPTDEIAGIMRISKSTVSYIRQAHTACINQDWSTLQKLSTTCRAVVDWAMRVTGTDKVFLKEFPKAEPDYELEAPAPEPKPAPETITRADFDYLKQSLSDICSLLIEIRDILK